MELLTEDIIIEALDSDGIMQEPDANWLLEYINSEYGGSLDNTSDWMDKRHVLKIYSCLLYTSPSPRDTERSRMPSSA